MRTNAEKYLDLLYEEPYKIGQWSGFTDLTPLNNEWIRDMLYATDDETILAHRGSYKTTCLSIAIALHMVLFPLKNIIFLRKTDDDVKEVVKQVANMLKSDLLNYFVKQIYGVDLLLVEETAYSITTSLAKCTKGASQLLGCGIKTSITGKHADLVITDDIVNLRDRVSRAERELIKTSYMELQNIKNRGGRIFNTGTPWHKDDAITTMPNKKIYTCYETGLIDRATLEGIRQSMTPSLFAANYELKHIADEQALFSNPVFFNNMELLYDGIAHIDAGYGGEDSTAFTIACRHDGITYMFGKKWRKHVNDCLDEIKAYYDMYRVGTVYCERNADKGYLCDELIKRQFIADDYHESTNKFIKISTYLRREWANVKWAEDTDPEYINEILDYTEQAEHDDAPDSAASILRELEGEWLT